MKLNLSSLISFTRRSKRGEMNPERDWSVLLIGTALLLALIVGWHVWAFGTVITGGTLGNAGHGAPPAAKTSVLDTIPAYLEKRAVEDANYVNGTYRFADPSQ